MSPGDSYNAERYREAWLRLAAPGLESVAPFRLLGPRVLRNWSPFRESGVAFKGDVLEKASALLAHDGEKLIGAFPAVTGVALSLRYRRGEVMRNEPCITFFVSEKKPQEALRAGLIPPEIRGIPTDVVEAGIPKLSALAPGHSPGSRLRPAEPGCSISHHRVKSGTFGCLVEDGQHVVYVLSCAHVMSDGSGAPGDAVFQPGTAFGGHAPADQIAELTRSIPLTPGLCIGDAAVAKVVDNTKVTPMIRYIGVKPAGTRTLSGVGFLVQKSGDETSLTHGVVVGILGTIGPYSANGVSGIYFNNAIISDGMSRGGDSGSLLMDYQGQAIGLHFGGLERIDASGQSTPVVSWYSPIDAVLHSLGVNLPP